MMQQIEKLHYYEDTNAQMLRLMYQNNDYCMEFYLARNPDKPICPFMIDENKVMYRRVDARIPKFTHRKKTQLIPVLRNMGVTDMFSQATSDFYKVCDKNAFVSMMVLEAVVIVDEKKTEAAGVTVAVSVNKSCLLPNQAPVLFNANRTFTYRIVHIPTRTDLFVGCYNGN
jgi:serine protease inhibitor